MADEFHVDDIVVYRSGGGATAQDELECLGETPLRIVEMEPMPAGLSDEYRFVWVVAADERFEWPASLAEYYDNGYGNRYGDEGKYRLDIYIKNLALSTWVTPVTMRCAVCDSPLTEIDYLCGDCR